MSRLEPSDQNVLKRSLDRLYQSNCKLILLAFIISAVLIENAQPLVIPDGYQDDATGVHLTSNTYPWISISLGHKIDKLVVHEKDKVVFIAADNDIFKYSRNLTLLDDTRRLKLKLILSGSPTNTNSSHIKILTLIEKSTDDLLLSCWQLRNSKLECALLKASDFRYSKLLWSNEPTSTATFTIDSHEQLKSLTSPRNPDDFIVTKSSRHPSTWDRPQRLTDPDTSGSHDSDTRSMSAIARFKLSKAPTFLYLDQKAVLPYRSRFQNFNLYYDYVYAFEYNDYTYFIVNDIRIRDPYNSLIRPSNDVGPDPLTHSVRLARICSNDTDFNSYTEISVVCNQVDGLYAKAAHLDISKSVPQLYIAFEKGDESTGAKKFMARSYLCSYLMELIESRFYSAVSGCQNGRESTHLLAKLHNQADHSPICQRNPSKDWCSSKTNPFIDGTSTIAEQSSSFDLQGMKDIEFVHSTSQSSNDVLFLGTGTGYLTKMTSVEDLLYTIDLRENKIAHYSPGDRYNQSFTSREQSARFGSTIESRANYVVSSRDIFAFTEAGDIKKFNMDSCNYYTSCNACLLNRDPLKCIWCGKSCSRRSDCPNDKISIESCPPVITSFRPSKGPISGATMLEISGENFGILDNRYLEIKIGSQFCELKTELSSYDRIFCYTKPVVEEFNATISVQVIEQGGRNGVDINGTARTEQPFYFKRVVVHGIDPREVLFGDEIEFVIHGQNMDAGRNRTLSLNDMKCTCPESTIKSDKIRCSLRTNTISRETDKTLNLTVKYVIDGFQQPIEVSKSSDGTELLSTLVIQASDLAQSINEEAQHDSGDHINWGSIVTLSLVLLTLLTCMIIIYIIRFDKFSGIKSKLTFPPDNEAIDHIPCDSAY